MYYPLSNTRFLLKFCGLQTQDSLCFHIEIEALTSPSWCKPGLAGRVGNTRSVRDAEHHCRTSLLSWLVSGMIGKYHHCSEAAAARELPANCAKSGLKCCPPSAGRGHKSTESAPESPKCCLCPGSWSCTSVEFLDKDSLEDKFDLEQRGSVRERRFIFQINTLPQHSYTFQGSTWSVPPWIKCFGLEKVIAKM